MQIIVVSVCSAFGDGDTWVRVFRTQKGADEFVVKTWNETYDHTVTDVKEFDRLNTQDNVYTLNIAEYDVYFQVETQELGE